MAEGPQVKRTTEWLQRQLAGRKLLSYNTSRDDLSVLKLRDRRVVRAFCKGKQIFLEIEGQLFIHNHLLMRGRWKRFEGQLLLPPSDAWLALYVGPYTVCNLRGQMLRIIGWDEAQEQLSRLGPDVMAERYPVREIETRLRSSVLPIAEALLDQRLVAGVGNIAKSEILFTAAVAPNVTASALDDSRMARLLGAIRETLWRSYHEGGRWQCSVYRKWRQPCPRCGNRLERVELSPSRRKTYFCPHCQQ